MTETPLPCLAQAYTDLCKHEGWQADDNQEQLVVKLDSVLLQLAPMKKWWCWPFNKATSHAGVYVHGPVGRGKTMLTNLAFDQVITPKQRWHFTAFMQMIHQQLKIHSQDRQLQPLNTVVKTLAQHYQVIMIDELQVTEIVDAMILLRLFQALLNHGITVFITSNLAPHELYKGGLHYDRFAPFVHLIENHYLIHYLNNDLDQDYRRRPDKSPIEQNLDQQFALTAMTEGLKTTELVVNERIITFTRSTDSSLWITFNEACEVAWGAGEYQAIAQHFGTVYLVNIPPLTANNRDAARRLMILVDCLYDQGRNLYIEAATELDLLYQEEGKNKLPFERTVSRLIEMQKHSIG